MGPSTHNHQNIFCVQQKKETHRGLKQLEGELMMTEFFWGTISLSGMAWLWWKLLLRMRS